MSADAESSAAGAARLHATVFAALGDETRLSLIAKLCERSPQSISRLTEGSHLSRQAISKHLDVLENADLVTSERVGRETQYEFKGESIAAVRDYLDRVSRQWDEKLARLKAFVEW